MNKVFRVSLLVWACGLQAGHVLADAVNHDAQTITIALTQEPPNLNSTLMTDLVSFFVIGHVNEGLVRYDRRGRLAPGVASNWEMDGETMTFTLREDARWSDGSPVTAQDFVFAWRLVNDPKTSAPFAAIMHPIRNAAKIQDGELPPSALGVEAMDATTLKVTLERPCGYCFGMMAHGTFYPIKQAFYESQGQAYGSDPDKLIYNGPFRLSAWTHNSSMQLLKSESYWDADAITLNAINVGYITEDNRTRLNLYKDERIALARLGAETVKDASNSGLRLKTFVSGGVGYLWFNHNEGRATADPDVRKAVQLVFDNDLYVNKVIAIPGYRPTQTLFPSWLRGVEGQFVDEYPPAQVRPDTVRARKLIEGKEIGEMTLLTVASPTGAKAAEYLQGLLKQSLGIEVKVDQQSFKQYLDKSRKRQFDIVLSSWYPDFDDIVTYADLLASWNPNNRGDYHNPEYDRWFRVLQTSHDRQTRMAAAAELQSIIIEEVPLLPMVETGSAYVQHPKLKGVVRRVIGQDPDYTYARVIE